MAACGEDHDSEFQQGWIWPHGIPAHDTFDQVRQMLAPPRETLCARWAAGLARPRPAMAMDSKIVRHSHEPRRRHAGPAGGADIRKHGDPRGHRPTRQSLIEVEALPPPRPALASPAVRPRRRYGGRPSGDPGGGPLDAHSLGTGCEMWLSGRIHADCTQAMLPSMGPSGGGIPAQSQALRTSAARPAGIWPIGRRSKAARKTSES